MPLRYVLPLLAVVLAPPGVAQPFEWTYMAGLTAPIDQFQLYPDGSVLGLSDGLLYRSGDEGLSWQMIATAPEDLSEFAVSGPRLWGLANGQVLTAAWLGVAWEVRGPDAPVGHLAVRGDSVFAATRDKPDRIYRSFDVGRTWEALTHETPTTSSGTPYAETALLEFVKSGLLYRQWLLDGSTSPVHWSEDHGATWTETACGPLVALDPVGMAGLTATLPSYSAGLNRWFPGRLLQTFDGGRTCEAVQIAYIFGLMRLRDGSWLVGQRDRLARIDNVGADWQTVGMENRGAVRRPLELPSRSLLIPTETFRAGPDDSFGTSYATGTYRLSKDSAEEKLTGLASHTPSIEVLDGALYAGGKGGLFRLTDLTASMDEEEHGWAFVGIGSLSRVGGLYIDGSRLLAFAGGTFDFFDYGYRPYDGTTEDFPSDGRFSVGVVGDMIRTSLGAIVTAVPQPVLPIANIGRSIERPGLLRFEGGEADPSAFFPVSLAGTLHESQPDVLYAGCVWLERAWDDGDCPGVLASTDDGRTWEALPDGLPTIDERAEVFAFTTDDTGTTLAATRDGVYALDGSTWTQRGLPGTWVFDLQSHPTAGTLAATERGVFRWDPDEEAWQPVGLGLEERTVYDILATDDLIDGETVLVAATDRGVFTSTPLVSIDAEDEAVPAEAFAVTAYPNPFAEALTVEVALAEATEVRTTVYDVLGRVVAEMPARLLGAGAHRLPMETDGLAPGVYLVRVSATGQPERVATVTRVR
ncbi:MAG: T9SS type A sorting domain-containing protein [Bacteroidota bacterium]